MKKLQVIIESHAFGVCTRLGEILGISSGAIRTTFIYLSFFTFGSPIILYIALAFLMDMPRHWRRKRSTIWDI